MTEKSIETSPLYKKVFFLLYKQVHSIVFVYTKLSREPTVNFFHFLPFFFATFFFLPVIIINEHQWYVTARLRDLAVFFVARTRANRVEELVEVL